VAMLAELVDGVIGSTPTAAPWPPQHSPPRWVAGPDTVRADSAFGLIPVSVRGAQSIADILSEGPAQYRPSPKSDPVRPEEDAGFLPRRDGSDRRRCYGAAEAWQLASGSGVG
jgi:hypothetical protein